MKTNLTNEQSATLYDLGLFPNQLNITLTDLLSLLPKEIDGFGLLIEYVYDKPNVYYHNGGGTLGFYRVADELIDALYELLIYLIENNYTIFESK